MSGGVVPPLLLSEDRGGGPLASFYGHICHQIPDRSFFTGAVQWSLCSRCVGIYGAIFLTTLVIAATRGRPRIPLIWGLLLIIPSLLDVLFSISGSSSLSNPLRLAAGFAAGFGGSAALFPRYLRLLE